MSNPTLTTDVKQERASAPVLHIVTGPPGSGKTTFSNELMGGELRVFDHDLGNKTGWQHLPPSRREESYFCAAAPSADNKEYWIQEAIKHGYIPKLYVMWVPRVVAYQRMRSRSGLSKTERNNLQSGVELWYKSYSRHPQEQRVDTGPEGTNRNG